MALLFPEVETGKVLNILPDLEDSQQLSYEQKLSLISQIKGITPEQLGIVVQRLGEECPACVQDIDKDRC